MDFWRIMKWAQVDPQTPTGRHDDVTGNLRQQRRTHSFTQWTNSDPPPPTGTAARTKGVFSADCSRSRVPFYFPSRAKRRRLQEYLVPSMTTQISPPSSPPSPPVAHLAQPDASESNAVSDHIEPRSNREKTPTRDPVNYPTPPTSDCRVPAVDSSPTTATDKRDQTHNNMPLPPKDFYPPSAYGPQGPRGYAAAAQAAQGTMVMVASGQFNGSGGSPIERPVESSSKRGPPQFFSEPPMPVYHNQPQSTASYYPAPHHQAQLLAQGRSGAPRLLGTANHSTVIDPYLQNNGNPAQSQSPNTQFVQGGIIYTPSVEELGLHSLSDGPPGEKPPYPYPTIIRCAILGSPRQRLTLSEIYTAMENRYPWFKTAGQGWKNSVRHNLSLNKCFAKVSRPITEPGKGAYWTVDLDAGEGNKRPRKRNKKPKQSKSQAVVAEEEYDEEDEEDLTGSEVSRSFSPDSGIPRDRPIYGRPPSQDRPTYSYPPPPPPPSTMIADSSTQHSTHSSHQGTQPNQLGTPTGLLTAAALGGQPRRIPIGPVGPMGEGRTRREEDEYSD